MSNNEEDEVETIKIEKPRPPFLLGGVYLVNARPHSQSIEEVVVTAISPDGQFIKIKDSTMMYATSDWKGIGDIKKLSTISEPEYKPEYIAVPKPKLINKPTPLTDNNQKPLSLWRRFVNWLFKLFE